MTSDGDPGIATEVRWDKVPDEQLPVHFANAFMVQHIIREDTFYLALGRVQPPMISDLMNKPKERQRLQRSGIAVTPIARVALTPALMRDLMGHLHNVYSQTKHGIEEQS